MEGFYCGYAPRVLKRLSSRRGDEEVLFVGSKDGSLTIIRRESSHKDFETFKSIGRQPKERLRKAVRVLLDYQDDLLIVGRDDGSLELVNWREGYSSAQPIHFSQSLDGTKGGESVRYATWLNRAQTRLLIAYRKAGTRLLTLDRVIYSEEELRSKLEESKPLERIGGIRVAAAIPEPQTPENSPGWFVLIDQYGALWLWDSSTVGQALPPKRLGEWSISGPSPATFEDFTYVGPAPHGVYKDICALLVTTDTGAFALDLRRKSWEAVISESRGEGFSESWPRPTRLALPGGNRLCTAVTYSEVEFSGGISGQLWLTNREGESRLFENKPLNEADFFSWVLDFQSSGRFQVDSQALTAVSWSERDLIWLAKACRDDRLRILCYSTSRGYLSSKKVTEAEFLRLQCQPRAGSLVREHLLAFLSERNPVSELASWPDYALLAELFDLRGGDPSSRDNFLEYLSQPLTDIPVAILISTSVKGGASKHLAAAVRLWTLSLLGIVNRHEHPREEWYLGILGFLRGLYEAVNHVSKKHKGVLNTAIEKAIRFTRKWGLYGQVNEVRQNLVSPLRILEDQYSSSARVPLDELTYYSLLLRRSYSEVAEETAGKREGDHAWAVKTVNLDCGTLVATSWRRQGIAFFVLESGNTFSSQLVRAVLPKEFQGSSRIEDSQGDRDRYNFSRDILLRGEGGNRICLLEATRSLKDSDFVDDLQLFSLELDRDEFSAWKINCVNSRRLSREGNGNRDYGSIYRFLDLGADSTGSRLVAAGLGGKRGKGEVVLVDISGTGSEDLKFCGHFTLSDYGPPETLSLVPSPDLEAFRNRVWSLAKVGEGVRSKAFLAGCDNGEIWYVELQDGIRSLCRLVAQLTSAVKALHAASVGGKLRVYAGTKDGTIVAFQELEERKKAAPHLAPLWATVESEEICHIDRHPYGLGDECFVLAMTRDGVCLAFDDRENAGLFDPNKKNPQRPPFPGIRWLRTSTGKKSFAATSFETLHGIKHSAWRLVATASENGCLRILSLHFPRYSLRRKAEFHRQCNRLWAVACDALIEGRGSSRGLAKDRAFRAVEAAYRSAPLLPLIIVRMLLDPGLKMAAAATENKWLDRVKSAEPWSLPQNIRPVLQLRLFWDKALLEDASETDIAGIGAALAAALDAAWAGRDLDLFQEICTLTLKRLNVQLFRPDDFNFTSLKNIYFSLFDVVRGRLQLWLGSPNRGEMRSRIVVGKNLLDGDTFYGLAQRAERDPSGPWQDILMKRVEGAVELILVGNDLVSLEALRAANHSLVRLCQRFSEARKSSSGNDLRALRWIFFRNYFSQLVHGAVQRLDANLSLGDAMTHEYSRTFALCFYACPEGLLNISSDLVDSRLIRDPRSDGDFTSSIQGQVEILANVFDLYGIQELWEFVQQVHVRFSFEALPKDDKVGVWEQENALNNKGASGLDALGRKWLSRRLREYGDLYRFVARFKKFSDSLSSDARDLGLATGEEIKRMSSIIPEEGERGVFPHSWDFWQNALESLGNLEGCPSRATERIRPEAILFIGKVARWADEIILDLEQRYSESLIFEPEYGIFREVLSRVKRAAGEFPSSAAVQNNLVVGILGHHLLEDLDLHVLELLEVARNLNPTESTLGRDPGDEMKSVAERFASLLVRRSQKAQSLPKNLRALAKVIEPSQVKVTGASLKSLFSDKFWNLAEWGSGDLQIASAREREYLTLIRSELEQNHVTHSGFGKEMKDDQMRDRRPILQWVEGRLRAKFPVSKKQGDKKWRKKRWQLVKKVVPLSRFGQEPLDPNPLPGVASTGVGLYLSCLAAAMIGWKMAATAQEVDDDGTLAGWLIIELYPQQTQAEQGAESLPVSVSKPKREDLGSVRNVVVIDDKQEVAYYVWRELGQATGFGSAEASEGSSSKAKSWSEPLVVPSGELSIWWVSATAGWRIQLGLLLKKDNFQAGSFFLVDVRGPVGESPGTGKQLGYDFREVLAVVKDYMGEEFPERVWLISSYEHGTRTGLEEGEVFEIRSKNPETLRQLREDILARSPKLVPRRSNGNPVHVLVTGAGFELQGRPVRQRIGMPPTTDLLKRWIRRAYPGVKIEEGGKFPFPLCHQSVSDLVAACAEGDLDQYWSSLFKAEREAAHYDISTIVRREFELRQLFRSEFVKHDWGFLPQAVAAARMGWSAWVSTNYTRFANRAIEISGGDWKTIEFGEEAQDLSRQMLHRDERQSGESILFKVHGDIGHVLTMALSMEDKAEETRLSSFLPLYLAAQAYLHELTRRHTKITWHIVGHGLKDRLLLHVIKTAQRIRSAKHRFVVIAPALPDDVNEKNHPAFELVRSLGSAKNVQAYSARADEYLMRLESLGGLTAYEEVLQRLEMEEKRLELVP